MVVICYTHYLLSYFLYRPFYIWILSLFDDNKTYPMSVSIGAENVHSTGFQFTQNNSNTCKCNVSTLYMY